MDDKQKRLVRNVLSGVILLVLVGMVLAYCGVFEGDQSDTAQVRRLVDRAKDEMNAHDWDDFFALCDLTPEEARAWEASIPQQAQLVVVDNITYREFLAVPDGATEYSINVTVLAHLEAPIVGRVGAQLDSVNGTLYFVKKDGRWLIDINKSAPTFPYLPQPKLPPR